MPFVLYAKSLFRETCKTENIFVCGGFRCVATTSYINSRISDIFLATLALRNNNRVANRIFIRQSSGSFIAFPLISRAAKRLCSVENGKNGLIESTFYNWNSPHFKTLKAETATEKKVFALKFLMAFFAPSMMLFLRSIFSEPSFCRSAPFRFA